MYSGNIYMAIDLKSFYASVECLERDLNPLTTNLVVADQSRTDKTICLAVTPPLKALGVPGRPRLFEAIQKVREINCERKKANGGKDFVGKSYLAQELAENKLLAVDFIIAPPQMALYMQKSAQVYAVYLKYIAEEDLHSYSIDEVFIDATKYLRLYKATAEELARLIIKDILATTGITATAGIGTNLYLAKIAMDIVAKRMPADENGVRVAFLDEDSYKEKLWEHTPITDFWRIGKGYAKKLSKYQLYTMGDIALCSLGSKRSFFNQELLYKLFGVNAELLIDHAWGCDYTTMAAIKSYQPTTRSISSGQVLPEPYRYAKARLIVREMIDLLVLDLVDKRLVTRQIVLTLGYDKDSLTADYKGEVVQDHYGRSIPKHGHGSVNLGCYSSSTELIVGKTMELFTSIADRSLLVRRVVLAAADVIPEYAALALAKQSCEQLDLFTDYTELEAKRQRQKEHQERERRCQEAILAIHKKFGKNSLLKGMNLEEGAKTIERNGTIGGHKAM